MLSNHFLSTKLMSIRWKTVVLISVGALTIACSSNTIEDKINAYEQEGKTILSSTLGTDDKNEFILYCNGEGIYLDNLNETIKLLSLNTSYSVYDMYARINRNKSGAVVRPKTTMFSSERPLIIKSDDIASYRIEVITDWCLLLRDRSDKLVYMFLPDSKVAYCVDDIVLYFTKYAYYNKARTDKYGSPIVYEDDREIYTAEDEIRLEVSGDLTYSDFNELEDGPSPLKALLPSFIYEWGTDIDSEGSACTQYKAEIIVRKGHIFDELVDQIEFKNHFSRENKFTAEEIGTTYMWKSVAVQLGDCYNIFEEEKDNWYR